MKLEENKMTLSMGRGRSPIVVKLPVTLAHVNRIELVYAAGRYHLHCAATEDVVKLQNPGNKTAAIDKQNH